MKKVMCNCCGVVLKPVARCPRCAARMDNEVNRDIAKLKAEVGRLKAENVELRKPDMWWPPGYEESGCADLDDWADDLCGVELPHRERILAC